MAWEPGKHLTVSKKLVEVTRNITDVQVWCDEIVERCMAAPE